MHVVVSKAIDIVQYVLFFSFPLLRGDCGRRGWYDCPQSALRLHTVWPNVPATPDVCKLVCEWVVCNSARGRCVLCRRDLVAICFIVPGIGRFVSQGFRPNVQYVILCAYLSLCVCMCMLCR